MILFERKILKEKERKMKFDYLIVGAGLFGAVFAHEATKAGKKCLVIDKRNHIAGNIYCEKIEDINVHKYGAHIFHTSNKKIWNYVNEFAEFNNYINSPVARYKDELYNLPFNMNTFSKLWNIATPAEAKTIIEKQKADLNISEPKNLEEQALSLVGTDVYEKLIKGYTEKQWGRDCKDLPAFIIKRLPLRFIYDNNYFNDRYTGVIGSNRLFDKLLDGATVKLNCAYSDKKHGGAAKRIIYTGMIDEFKHYRLGKLPYRSLRFVCRKVMPYENQGVAVINYTDSRPYTRSCEYGYMYGGRQTGGLRWYEYPLGELDARGKATEPYYPMPTAEAGALYEEYAALAKRDTPDGVRVYFGGRLGEYKYINMDQAVERALKLVNEIYHSEIKGVNL